MGEAVKLQLKSGRYMRFDTDDWTPELHQKIRIHTLDNTYRNYRGLMQQILPADDARLIGTPVAEPDMRGTWQKMWEGEYSEAFDELGIDFTDRFDVKEPEAGVDYDPNSQSVLHFFDRPVVVPKSVEFAANSMWLQTDEYRDRMLEKSDEYERGSFGNFIFRMAGSARDSSLNVAKGAGFFGASLLVSPFEDKRRLEDWWAQQVPGFGVDRGEDTSGRAAIKNVFGDEHGDIPGMFEQGKEFLKFHVYAFGALDPETGQIRKPSWTSLADVWADDPAGAVASLGVLKHSGARIGRGAIGIYADRAGRIRVRRNKQAYDDAKAKRGESGREKAVDAETEILSDEAIRAREGLDIAEETITGKAVEALDEVVKDLPPGKAVEVINTALDMSEAQETMFARMAPEQATEMFKERIRKVRLNGDGKIEYIFENEAPTGIPEFVNDAGRVEHYRTLIEKEKPVTGKAEPIREAIEPDVFDAETYGLGKTEAPIGAEAKPVAPPVEAPLTRGEAPRGGPRVDVDVTKRLSPTGAPVEVPIPVPERIRTRSFEAIDAINEQIFPDQPGELLRGEAAPVLPELQEAPVGRRAAKIARDTEAKGTPRERVTRAEKGRARGKAGETIKRTRKQAKLSTDDIVKKYNNDFKNVPETADPMLETLRGEILMHGGPPVEQLWSFMRKLVTLAKEGKMRESLNRTIFEKPTRFARKYSQGNTPLAKMIQTFAASSKWNDPYVWGQLKELNRQLAMEQIRIEDMLRDIKDLDTARRINRIMRGVEEAKTPWEKKLQKDLRELITEYGQEAVEAKLLNADVFKINEPNWLPRLFDIHYSPGFGDSNMAQSFKMANVPGMLMGKHGNPLRAGLDRFKHRMPVLTPEEVVAWERKYNAKLKDVKTNRSLSRDQRKRQIKRIAHERKQYLTEAWFEEHVVDNIFASMSKVLEVKHDVLVRGVQRNVYNNPKLSLEGRIFNKALGGEQPGQYSRSWTIDQVKRERAKNTGKQEGLKKNKKQGTQEYKELEETIRKQSAAIDAAELALKESADYWHKVPGVGSKQAKNYGMLADTHVPRHVWEGIRDASQGMGLAYNVLSSIIKPWKTGKTVLNPSTHARNVMWNMYAAWMADVSPLDKKLYLEAIRAVTDRSSPYYKDIRAWELASSGYANVELMRSFKANLSKNTKGNNVFTSMHDAVGQHIKSKAKGAWEKGKQGVNKAADIYGMEEAVFKAAIYINEIKKHGATQRMAAAKAQKYLFDYNDVSRALKWARVIPGAGMPFATFHAKFYPLMLETAINKPWKLAPMLAAPAIIAALARMQFGNEEYDKAKKARAPWEQRYFSPVAPDLLGLVGGDAKPQTFNMTNLFPFADALDLERGIFSEIPVLGLIPPALQPFQEPIGRTLWEINTNKTQLTGKKIYDEDAPKIWDIRSKDDLGAWAYKGRDVFDYAYKQAMPPLAPALGVPWTQYKATEGGYSWQKLSAAFTGGEDYFGRKRSPVAAVADTMFGLKSSEINMESLDMAISRVYGKIAKLERQIASDNARKDYSKTKKMGLEKKNKNAIRRLKKEAERLEK
ncbi:MAG: hypothetical protein GY833_16625 [Aestuariibacter sp.]|nr:hypothetical protein [Aestuariibacter sp.]